MSNAKRVAVQAAVDELRAADRMLTDLRDRGGEQWDREYLAAIAKHLLYAVTWVNDLLLVKDQQRLQDKKDPS